MTQFQYSQGDIVEIPYVEYDYSTIILALLAIENAHPGIMFYLLRLAALANGGWNFTANSSNPAKSRSDQEAFRDWLDAFQSALESQTEKGE